MILMKIVLLQGLIMISLPKILQAQQPMNTGSGTQIIHELSAKEQAIVTVSAFTTQGDLIKLQQALNNGLDIGVSINEVKEVIVQLYAYAGFPRSLNALNTFMAVLKERKSKRS